MEARRFWCTVMIGKFFDSRVTPALGDSRYAKINTRNEREASVNDEFNISRDKSFDMNEDAARRGATRWWRRVRSRGRSPVDSGFVLCRNAADKIISFQGSPREWRSGSALGIACIGIAKKLRSIHLSTNALWTRRTTQFPFQPQKLRLFHLELDGLIFIISYGVTDSEIYCVSRFEKGRGAFIIHVHLVQLIYRKSDGESEVHMIKKHDIFDRR